MSDLPRIEAFGRPGIEAYGNAFDIFRTNARGELVAAHSSVWLRIDTKTGKVLERRVPSRSFGFYEEYLVWSRGDYRYRPDSGGVIRESPDNREERYENSDLLVCGGQFFGIYHPDQKVVREVRSEGTLGSPVKLQLSGVDERLFWDKRTRRFGKYRFTETTVTLDDDCWESKYGISDVRLFRTGVVVTYENEMNIIENGVFTFFSFDKPQELYECRVNPEQTELGRQ